MIGRSCASAAAANHIDCGISGRQPVGSPPCAPLSTIDTDGLASAKEVVRLDPIRALNWEPDVLAVGERVAYMWCASGMIESRLATAAARLLGDAVTTRNWATMLKVHALLTTE